MRKNLTLVLLCFSFILFAVSTFVSCKQDAEQVYKVGDVGPAKGFVFYDKGEYTDGWRYLEAAPWDLKLDDDGKPVIIGDYDYYGSDVRFCFGYYRETADGDNLFVNGTVYHNGNGEVTGYDVGTGLNNTKLLVDAMGDSAWTDYTGEGVTDKYAAKLCYDLVYNGFDDWFLPSAEELKLMYDYNMGKGNFRVGKSYWSSTEYSTNSYTIQHGDILDAHYSYHIGSGDAYWLNTNDGIIRGIYSRSANMSVRPVRAF